ncbi:DNA alkylation repair protein [Emticicia sp. BO119]|uniref:DNA alkylation repair protein n=1 Tax=Emticicia sp. BO119 TaxID=2757768 RepID=UPI0015F0CBAF|nr:DNA alkylation repair protein [Emticicia sp. BO119]MBA4852977.1 DNA alkylation repair protein [Emticicia sp. BO119]
MQKKARIQQNTDINAEHFIQALYALQSDEERLKIQRYFKTDTDEKDEFIGVKMGQLFSLAQSYVNMPVAEIEKLLESPIHEVRAGAISIMDKASREKKIKEERLKEFFDLYIRRHDRVNNWDLVDLGCLNMVGRYLFDKSHKTLYDLAHSFNRWERRTAILGTCYFIKKGEIEDTFTIAEILIHDKEDLVNKATGWMLRFAGDKNPEMLKALLDKYAASMPRTLLRYSIEHFDATMKEHYMQMAKKDKNHLFTQKL